MNSLNQNALLARYAQQAIPPFNPHLFERDTNKIIKALQDIIISSQKVAGYYKIIVEDFTIVEDYARIREILARHEDGVRANGKKKRINQYKYINLKDSDTVLMIIHYYIEAKGQSSRENVYCLVPRVVDKYYFKISGNYYSPQLQIAEGSTYNNAHANNKHKKECVTLKTVNNVIMQVYKNRFTVTDIYGRELEMINFGLYVFTKSDSAFKYVFAKYGLTQTMQICNFNGVWFSKTRPEVDTNLYYSFEIKEDEIFITVPIMMYENDITLQAFIYTLMTSVYKVTTLEDLFESEFWIYNIGRGVSASNSFDKGLNLCSSLESIYDIPTKNSILLPEHLKQNIYQIILWIMREYTGLMQKDNGDMEYKVLKNEEYIASLYASKLNKNSYRISDSPRITLDKIKKAIVIRPTILLENITKCNLINYKNSVNDLDGITATKMSFKAPRIGKGASSKASRYKDIHPSQLGRVDIDSSSKSDPGATGVLCPMVELYGENNDRFSDKTEPNTWEDMNKFYTDQYMNTFNLTNPIEVEPNLCTTYDCRLDRIREQLGNLANKKLGCPIEFEDEIPSNDILERLEGGISYE